MTSKEYLLNIESSKIKLGLSRTIQLLNLIGNPEKDIVAIQIAGTNGKGSTAAMLAKILECAGYKVGLFTSPHLVDINERIRINGKPISDKSIDKFVLSKKKHIENLSASFFETVTAMGFWYFKKSKVDIAVMETGLGGRLDSVTTCNPILTIITPISLDHTEILGNSLEKIAFEKAGIMKPNIKCISSIQNDKVKKVLNNCASEIGCQLIYMKREIPKNITLSIAGRKQYDNACLAITASKNIKNFSISENAIKQGIKNTNWYGRNQVIQKEPLIVFDVAHNESGFKGFLDYFSSLKKVNKTILVISLQKGKKINGIVEMLHNQFNEIICCETKNPRTMTLLEISKQIGRKQNIVYIKCPITAIQTGLKLLNSKQARMAILGTHHFGEPIKTIFNKSFEKL